MYGAVRERGGGQYPFDGRGDRPRVGGARLFKIDKRQNFPRHRRKGRPSQHDILPQPLFACFDLQPLAVYNGALMQVRSAACRSKGALKSHPCGVIRILAAVTHQLRLFLVGERAALLGLIAGQYDLRHRGGDLVIVRRHVEDTA